MFALVGLVGDRRALSREPRAGGRRCRRDRADAVELCARGPHGGFHRESTDEIDGMTDRRKAARRSGGDPQGNGRGFARTRRARPRRRARAAARGGQFARRSMRPPKPRTSAAGWRQEQQQASSYAAAQFARDMLAIKDHLERALVAVNDELRGDKTASQFLAGIEATARELEAVFAAQRHQPHQVDRRDARPAPPPGDDGNPDRRGRARHHRRGNAARLHDQGPAASARRWSEWRKSPTNAPRGDGSRSWWRG